MRNDESQSNGLSEIGDIVLLAHRSKTSHTDGYSIGEVAKILPEERFQVKLIPGEQLVSASSEDIFKASYCKSGNHI